MNENKRIIVVGGVAAGMSFATRYKRLFPYHEVLVFDKGQYVSFANCGLPYAISGTISSRSRLIIETKERLEARFEIDVFTEAEVLSVNPVEKSVLVRSRGREKTFTYDGLVLAPGAKPIILNIPGINREDVFALRNIPDLDNVMTRINETKAQNALVIGAGFIGLEVAENLRMKGLNVTIVEKSPQLMPPLDIEMTVYAEQELNENGIKFFADNEVIKVDGKKAILKSGHEIDFDFVVMSVGITPDTAFLKDSGIKLGPRGHLLVDDNYLTNMKDVYAIGDAILVKQQTTGELVNIALANPANRQGRQLADHLAGIKISNTGTIGTAILKLFNRSFGMTGLNERQLKTKGLNYRKIYLSWFDHATYYPGATPLLLKIMFNPEGGLVYGAEAVGKKGVDKRIDVLSTAIKANMPINMFQALEFAYAPPFSLAKDIINLAGYYASNVMLGITELVEWEDVEDRIANGAILVDVRSERERIKHGYIKNSINIPLEQFREEFEQLPKDKEIILYCESGTKGYNAERILKANGYNAKNLNGSFIVYKLLNKHNIIFNE